MHRSAAILALVISCVGAQQSDAPVKFGVTVVIPSGLKGQVYKMKEDSDRLPNFAKLKKPIATIYTSTLNIPPQDFQEGFPGFSKRVEWFAIDYTGRFWIENPGRYRFLLNSDDGSKLYIDDQLIIDNDGIHAPTEKGGEATLDHGVHRIRVSYFQGPRYSVALVLQVARPGENYRIFSTDELKPPPDYENPQTQSPQ